jgi:hypothetical protein
LNISVARRSTIFAVVLVALVIGAWRTTQRLHAPLHAELRADSTEIGVRFGGEVYLAKIRFVFVNTTADTVSIAGCGGPPMPQVEKLVNGKWVAAYYPAYPACRTTPDFSLPSGATYRNEVDFMPGRRGGRTGPFLEVDSINGVYRLHWGLRTGSDAYAPGSRPVEAISNQFRMTLR